METSRAAGEESSEKHRRQARILGEQIINNTRKGSNFFPARTWPIPVWRGQYVEPVVEQLAREHIAASGQEIDFTIWNSGDPHGDADYILVKLPEAL